MNLPAKKSQIISLLVLTVLAGGLFFLSRLLLSRIQDSSLTVAQSVGKLGKKNLSIQNLRANLQLVKEMDEKITTSDNYFFTPGEELDLITDLENIASKNNITQQIVSSNLDDCTDGEMKIGLNAAGRYLDALRYLNDLENYEHFLVIRKIEFQPTNNLPGDPTDLPVAVKIEFSLYAK